MSFTNIHGQPIDVSKAYGKKPAAKKSSKSKDAQHKGWLALGYSPGQIAEAREEHESPAKREKEGWRPFNEDSFMRLNKPEKISKKPYFSNEAAQTACDLATKQGWKNCRTQALERGGR